MKCVRISVGNESPKDDRTWEEFLAGKESRTLPGELLVQLVAENTWSREIAVDADFPGTACCLLVQHPVFRPDSALEITAEQASKWSVRDVENAVRMHLDRIAEGNRSSIRILSDRIRALDNAAEQITVDKARASILAFYPEAAGAEYRMVSPASYEFYAFQDKSDERVLFVARVLADAVVGAARVSHCSYSEWFRADEGVRGNQRHGLFWTGLARRFAARELKVHEDVLWCEGVFAEKLPWTKGQIDPYRVERVALRIPPSNEDLVGHYIVVEFDGNLPYRLVVPQPATA